ncbi:HP1 [Hepatospora eriocheir]|uniref:HP1 n=1 Tax=Hepatospora eriocheir TaxID=1081669 RepID=A0A1X0QEV2_9MICR|nr:HP1 [Hepatospora eriocheir]
MSFVQNKISNEEDCLSDGVYEVEKIIDNRIVNDKNQYKIKWYGYPESESTWEFKENLFCEKMLEEYHNSKTSNKKKKTEEVVFNQIVTCEWEDHISRIVAIAISPSGTKEVEYENKDGTKGVCDAVEFRYKAPIKLIEFYEEHLNFTE